MWAFLRMIIGASANTCYFISMEFLPLGKASILFFMAPLYLPVICRIWFKEDITKFDIIALLFGFSGMVLV